MLEILRRFCPFPTIDGKGTIFNGFAVAQPRACTRCKTRSCTSRLSVPSTEQPEHAVCEFNYSTVLVPTPYGSLLINGVIVPGQNLRISPAERKQNKKQKVTLEQINHYRDGLSASLAELRQVVDNSAVEAIAGFHDIQTAVNIVLRNAEAIIDGLPGDDDAARIEGATPHLKALLKSVALLKSRLALATILANPESARYGQPHPTPVYRVFHRMVRLFAESAERNGIRLRMARDFYSLNLPQLFDSFETIPLILIDNAVKYAYPRTEVVVTVEDFPGARVGCSVSVESEGDVVPVECQAMLFQRGYRSPQAKKQVSSGSGLGLFLAQTVAKANGFSIRYDGTPFEPGESSGRNLFSFVAMSLL